MSSQSYNDFQKSQEINDIAHEQAVRYQLTKIAEKYANRQGTFAKFTLLSLFLIFLSIAIISNYYAANSATTAAIAAKIAARIDAERLASIEAEERAATINQINDSLKFEVESREKEFLILKMKFEALRDSIRLDSIKYAERVRAIVEEQTRIQKLNRQNMHKK